MSNYLDLSLLCTDDINEVKRNNLHGQVLEHVLPDLIDFFTKRGILQEDIEDTFAEVYFSAIAWACKQSKPISFEFLFRVFRRFIYRHLPPDKKKTVKLPDDLNDVQEEELKVIDEGLRSTLLYECIEKLPDYLKSVIMGYLKDESTSAAARAATLRISINDYYVRANHARKQLKNCLESNPLWSQQF